MAKKFKFSFNPKEKNVWQVFYRGRSKHCFPCRRYEYIYLHMRKLLAGIGTWDKHSSKRSLAISVSRDTKNKCATATFKNKGMFAVGRFLNPPNPSVLLQALFVNLTVMSVYHIVIYCILNQSTSMFLNVVLASFRSWTAICLTQRCPAVAARLSAVWGSTWLDSLLSWTAFSLDSAPVPDIADHKFKQV